MPKRPGASKSIFASLPQELRVSIRAQPLLPLDGDIVSVQAKSEAILAEVGGRFLSTQPDEAIVVATAAEDLTHELHPIGSPEAGPSKANDTYDPPAKKRRVASRKGKARDDFEGHPWDCTGLVQRFTSADQVPKELVKYWHQRHFLLPLYDELPLLLDTTGWFSITPQPIAAHIAERCRCDVIVDAFCGVGGNAIEFAKTCERVIAIDNDPTRLRLARHNALHLGVADRIDFILADFVEWAKGPPTHSIDVVFLSPPWGGPDYLSSEIYPLSAVQPIHGRDLFQLASTLTPNIAYYLPRNVDVGELGGLAKQTESEREWVEVEEEWVGDKLKAVTAYFGSLVADE